MSRHTAHFFFNDAQLII